MECKDYHTNSGRTFRYEDFGFNVETDCEKMVLEVLVILLAALDESWKVPIVYFATAGTNAEQKSKLMLITVEFASGREIKTITSHGNVKNYPIYNIVNFCYVWRTNWEPITFTSKRKS